MSTAAGLLVWLYCQPFEDLFITLRYAENWATGTGLRFNPGEDVEGFSSFSWVAIHALAALLRLDLDVVSTVLSVAAGALMLVMITYGAKRIAGLPGLSAYMPALAVAVTATWAYSAGTGMETTAHAACILLAWAVLSRDGTRRSLVAAGLFLGLALLTRPEAPAYVGAIALGVALGRRGRDGIVVGGVAAALFAPWLAWRWTHYGYPLPNTYYAKADPSWELWLEGLRYVEAFMSTHVYWMALPLGVFAWRKEGDKNWLILAFAVCGAAIVTSILGGGDTFFFYRFLLPALPLLALLIVVGAVQLCRDLPPLKRHAVLGAAAALWIGMGVAAPRGLSTSLSWKGRVDEHKKTRSLNAFTRDYRAIGRLLRRDFPADTWIATNAAGIIPYVSGLATIDMLGLNDAHIAHLDIELGHGPAGHEKYDGNYVLDRRPGVILFGLPRALRRPPNSAQELRAYLRRITEHLPGDREILANPEFVRHYRPLVARLDDSRFALMFVRRGVEPRPKR